MWCELSIVMRDNTVFQLQCKGYIILLMLITRLKLLQISLDITTQELLIGLFIIDTSFNQFYDGALVWQLNIKDIDERVLGVV